MPDKKILQFRLYIRAFGSFFKLFLIAVLLGHVLINDALAQDNELQGILQAKMAQLQESHSLDIRGTGIAAVTLIPELYSRRNYTIAWKDSHKRDELIDIVRGIRDEGLNPEDYLLTELEDYSRQKYSRLTDEERVNFDILLTESLVRLGYHLRFGKVDPESLDPDWNLDRRLENEDPVAIIQAAINSDSIRNFIDRAIPRQPFYERYKKALARYRAIGENGGWPLVPKGPSLKPGMSDSRVPVLRQRLISEGYLPSGRPLPAENYFDAVLEQAVKSFQQTYGLDTDGVVGKDTLAALNVSVQDRIDQIRVNLERGRWVLKDVHGEFLIVNIAGFKAYLVRDDALIWTSRVIVGRTYRKTPVFKSQIEYLTFNPTWTVPPTILRKDVLPRIKKDPGYISEQHFKVLDAAGRPVDPDSIEWSSFNGKTFPYLIRQEAGPENALGRIKFNFPNSHFVYLHDTPHRELFNKPERTFSSGCIRIENPVELAELLLNDREKWSRANIEQSIATGETRTVNLSHPVTIMLLYWTVVIEQDGTVNFRKDIYNRDSKLLDALNADFSFSLPKGLPERYYH